MPSEDVEKFFEWAKKVEELLKQNTPESLNELPDAYRWMSYREQKILAEEPENYYKIQDLFIKLSGESAKKLHADCLQKLEEAKHHQIGTKVRLRKIMLYVYYYEKYVHRKFILGEMENEAVKIVEKFWTVYLDELVKYRKSIDPEQIQWIIDFAALSKGIGIGIDAKKFSQIAKEYKSLEKSEEEIEFELELEKQFARDLDCWESQKVEFKKKGNFETLNCRINCVFGYS